MVPSQLNSRLGVINSGLTLRKDESQPAKDDNALSGLPESEYVVK